MVALSRRKEVQREYHEASEEIAGNQGTLEPTSWAKHHI